MTSMHATDPVGWHYMLCAYVCEGVAHPPPFSDPVTFTKIFQARPDNCRYAVARLVPLTVNHEPSGPLVDVGMPSDLCVVWDLHDDRLVRGLRSDATGMIMPPPPVWRGESEDSMVMKAIMQYGDG